MTTVTAKQEGMTTITAKNAPWYDALFKEQTGSDSIPLFSITKAAPFYDVLVKRGSLMYKRPEGTSNTYSVAENKVYRVHGTYKNYYFVAVPEKGSYWFVPKSNTVDMSNWITRPTSGTLTAEPDKHATEYGLMGWEWPLVKKQGDETDKETKKHISYAFLDPDYGNNPVHWGFDLGDGQGNAGGKKIYAAADGVVKEAAANGVHNRCGNMIAIVANDTDPKNGINLIYTYMHMRDFPKKADGTPYRSGDLIKAGDLIGYIGGTASPVTFPIHFHMQVSRNGIALTPSDQETKVNPIYFFPTTEFTGDTTIYYDLP